MMDHKHCTNLDWIIRSLSMLFLPPYIPEEEKKDGEEKTPIPETPKPEQPTEDRETAGRADLVVTVEIDVEEHG